MKRNDFSDIGDVSYIEYLPLGKIDNNDYVHGEVRTITLRNKETNEPEEITYRLCGAVPLESSPGYYWYWGEVLATGPNAYLAFYFDGKGELNKITVSFAAKDPSDEAFRRWNGKIKYGAQISLGAKLDD